MEKMKIDFLKEFAKNKETTFTQYVPKKYNLLGLTGRIFGAFLGIILIIGISYSTKAFISGQKLSAQFGNTTVFSQLRHLVGANTKLIKGESNDRINILLMGIGGENHEGGQLTDTLMVASIRPSDKSMGLLSIPRDLVAPIPGIGWQKINSAQAYGKTANPDTKGAGPALTKATVEDITGLKIDYYVKIDFSGFTKIIDALGGVRVYVPQKFTDYQYPDENYGYQTISFDTGWQDLNGDLALKYARSRHGNNNEGSDFARARRQQDILEALQKRALALSTLLNPNKLISLSDIVGKNMETDMEIWESLKLFEIAKQINTKNIKQVVLSSDNNGLLSSEVNEDGAYVLRPRLGSTNFTEIKLAAENLIKNNNDLKTENLTEETVAKQTRVVVQNGTTYPGLAGRTAELLQTLSYQVISVGNAPRRDYEKTVIYNLSTNASSTPDQAIQNLQRELKANIATNLPNFIKTTEADILIIVGKDSIPSDSLSLL